MPSVKLSPTQEAIVAAMRANGGVLVRLKGGFWTYRGCPTKEVGWAVREAIPETYWATGSVQALLRYGVVEASLSNEYGMPQEIKLVGEHS